MLTLGFLIKVLKLYSGYAFVIAFTLQSTVVLLLAVVASLLMVVIKSHHNPATVNSIRRKY